MHDRAGSLAISRAGTIQGLQQIDTPALLLDLDAFDSNVKRISETCLKAGIGWRPHIKGIKTPELVARLLAAGAHGATCAKLGEAEVMTDAGIGNLLIANQIVGPVKIARLVSLRRRADIMVAVDSVENVRELSRAMNSCGLRLRVVIEVDIGIRRAGVLPGNPVLELAKAIAAEPAIQLCGVMGWEGHAAGLTDPDAKRDAVRQAVANLVTSAEMCRAAGLPCDIVSCGGTGTYLDSAQQPGVTEIQAGGGVFGDVHYRTHYGIDHPFALTVLTTITSRPNPTRIICDAGKKAMSGDMALPDPIGLQSIRSVRLSAEHVTVELDEPDAARRVGDTLEFVVGYSDTTVHLHDRIYALRGGQIEASWPIAAAGRYR